MESSTREVALRRRRERERDRRARETVAERECRLSKRRARDRKRANELRTSDTSAQSDVRLGKRRLQHRDAYVSLSVEATHARIETVSNARRQRIAAQSPNERDARLQQLRTAREQRIATESMEERQTRLQQLRSAQQDRIDAETAEEREARLQQLGIAQQQRIAAESTEEREARQLTDRQYHTQIPALQPSQLHQPHILHKMKQFHSKLANLQVGRCFTCLEEFPGMSVRSVSTSSTQSECLRCTRDKHSPKLYSSANNMNPGVVPPQLMVRFYTFAILM